jgi:hypothetical protein
MIRFARFAKTEGCSGKKLHSEMNHISGGKKGNESCVCGVHEMNCIWYRIVSVAQSSCMRNVKRQILSIRHVCDDIFCLQSGTNRGDVLARRDSQPFRGTYRVQLLSTRSSDFITQTVFYGGKYGLPVYELKRLLVRKTQCLLEIVWRISCMIHITEIRYKVLKLW